MIEPSLDAATRISGISNLALIISLAVGLVAIILIVWMGNIKESYLRQEIARLSAVAEESRAKSAEAELKLEQLRKQVAPRVINVLEFAEDLRPSPIAGARIIYPKDDVESFGLSMQIFSGLMARGWNVDNPSPIQPSDSNIFPDSRIDLFEKVPAPLAAGGNVTGVSVVVNQTGSSDARKAGRMLVAALLKALGSVTSGELPISEDIRIIVGPKP